MRESQAIGIRLENKFLNKIETLGKEENLDRSTTMRLLLEEGYSSRMKKKAAKDYMSGKITISSAAEKARLTIWEMEQFLILNGFKSQYSIQDLKEEIAGAKKK